MLFFLHGMVHDMNHRKGALNLTVNEKLKQMEEMDDRNAERISKYLAMEVIAEGVHKSLDAMAERFGENREKLFDLLIATLQAMQQIRDQEG